MQKAETMVSVCMLTYNHEAFVAQAIEGVLSQTTDFPIEVVVADDHSTDGTAEICRRYGNENAEVIRLIERSENLGVSENFRLTLNECRGKYIAICEGDDYWTDREKLAKQVQFMEANQDYAMCFHNALVTYEGKKAPHPLTDGDSRDCTFKDFIERAVVVGPVGMLFRRDAVPIFDDGTIVFDWFLFLILSNKGKVRFINELSSVYRRHDGNWTNVISTKKADFFLQLTVQCKEYFAPDHAAIFDRWLGHCYADLCFAAFSERDKETFERNLRECRRYYRSMSIRTRAALLARRYLLYVRRTTAASI